MFYNYLTQSSTDRLNHFSTDLTTKKSCGMDEKEFKTKKYCGMDESAFLTKKSMGKPENLQYTKEINSSEAKNFIKTDNQVQEEDEDNIDKDEEITNNIIVQKDENGKSMINNNIMINKPSKGGKVIINNNIITDKEIGENDEVVINNNFYFNPYVSKFISQSDKEVVKNLCEQSEVTRPRASMKESKLQLDEELLSRKFGKVIDVPKRKLVTYGLHKGYTTESILGTLYKCNPVFTGKFINVTILIQKCNEIYDTSTIITGEIYNYLPSCIKVNCRLIDVVIIIKGDPPHQLYSVDCFPENQEPFEEPDSNATEVRKKKQMVIKQLIEETIELKKKSSFI